MTEIIALNLQMLDSRAAHEAPNVQVPGREGQEGSFADYGFGAPVDVDEPATSLDKGSPLQNPDDELPF
jgi:single-stranded DNA-binding protein